MLQRNIFVALPLMFTCVLTMLIRHGTTTYNRNNFQWYRGFINMFNRYTYHIYLFPTSLWGRLFPLQRYHLIDVLLRSRWVTTCLSTTYMRRGHIKRASDAGRVNVIRGMFARRFIT